MAYTFIDLTLPVDLIVNDNAVLGKSAQALRDSKDSDQLILSLPPDLAPKKTDIKDGFAPRLTVKYVTNIFARESEFKWLNAKTTFNPNRLTLDLTNHPYGDFLKRLVKYYQERGHNNKKQETLACILFVAWGLDIDQAVEKHVKKEDQDKFNKQIKDKTWKPSSTTPSILPNFLQGGVFQKFVQDKFTVNEGLGDIIAAYIKYRAEVTKGLAVPCNQPATTGAAKDHKQAAAPVLSADLLSNKAQCLMRYADQKILRGKISWTSEPNDMWYFKDKNTRDEIQFVLGDKPQGKILSDQKQQPDYPYVFTFDYQEYDLARLRMSMSEFNSDIETLVLLKEILRLAGIEEPRLVASESATDIRFKFTNNEHAEVFVAFINEHLRTDYAAQVLGFSYDSGENDDITHRTVDITRNDFRRINQVIFQSVKLMPAPTAPATAAAMQANDGKDVKSVPPTNTL